MTTANAGKSYATTTFMLTVSRRWRILLRARRFSSAVDVDKSALRFVRIHGLPTGYNLSEIVTAARGGPILQVVPAENEVLLKFYSWTQAAACSKAPIKVESGEYRAELDKSGNGELIGADVVARLGGLQAHRTLQVHFPPGHKFMVPTNVEHWLTPTGPREFCRTFETKSGKAGANIAFLDEEDAVCALSVVSYIRSLLTALVVPFFQDEKRLDRIQTVDLFIRELLSQEDGSSSTRIDHRSID